MNWLGPTPFGHQCFFLLVSYVGRVISLKYGGGFVMHLTEKLVRFCFRLEIWGGGNPWANSQAAFKVLCNPDMHKIWELPMLSMLQLGGLEGEGEGNISEQQQQLANVSRRAQKNFLSSWFSHFVRQFPVKNPTKKFSIINQQISSCGHSEVIYCNHWEIGQKWD